MMAATGSDMMAQNVIFWVKKVNTNCTSLVARSVLTAS